jgi:ribonuclease HI
LRASEPRFRTATGANLKLVIHVDGGARGNPGPAAIGVVVSDGDGEVVEELAEPIGVATNNVAEYRAVLRALERAAALGATELELIGDSELVARQLTGAYKVKHPSMKPLHARATSALSAFDRWSIRSVPRAQNARADALVNAALDGSAGAAGAFRRSRGGHCMARERPLPGSQTAGRAPAGTPRREPVVGPFKGIGALLRL